MGLIVVVFERNYGLHSGSINVRRTYVSSYRTDGFGYSEGNPYLMNPDKIAADDIISNKRKNPGLGFSYGKGSKYRRGEREVALLFMEQGQGLFPW